jgi:citrate synthase
MDDHPPRLVTTVGKAERDRVILRGYDLTKELVGHVSFAHLTYLMLMGRMPTEGQARMVDALLTVLVEHGMTGSAIAARLTYASAPEALQGAVAAALLSAGSVHLGTATDCARLLHETLAAAPADADLDALATQVVEDYLGTRRIIPGLGHAQHTAGDPRAERLFAIARETEVYGRYCALLERIAARASERRGRLLPVNVTGAMGAIACELGVPWQVAKGFALIGRTLGALAHLADEVRDPLARHMVGLIESHLVYQDPSRV